MSTTVQAGSHALLIGIGAYRYLNPLARTASDARDVGDVLSAQGIPTANLALLLDENASKTAIGDQLVRLAQSAGPDETVVIFFSGHGAQVAGSPASGEYLCPVDARLDDPGGTMISSAEFTIALRAIQARRLVVFLDACHAGGVGEPKDATTKTTIKAGLTETAYAELAGGGARVIIASCRPDEVSWELSGMRNGLFTHHLLEGVREGAARSDGTVWMSALFGYVYDQVSRTGYQHPYQKAAGEDFVVSVAAQPRPTGQTDSGADIPFDINQVDQKWLRRAMHNAYDREEFVLLCSDLGMSYDDLRGETLSTKIMYLIDKMVRSRQYERLVRKVLEDRPFLVPELLDQA
jgi:hypothetical protein